HEPRPVVLHEVDQNAEDGDQQPHAHCPGDERTGGEPRRHQHRPDDRGLSRFSRRGMIHGRLRVHAAWGMPMTSSSARCRWCRTVAVCASVTCEKGKSVSTSSGAPRFSKMARTTFFGSKSEAMTRPPPNFATTLANSGPVPGAKARV